MYLISWIIIGMLAGALAGKRAGKIGEGIQADLLVGIIGALTGGGLFAMPGVFGANWRDSLVTASLGAILLLLIARMIGRLETAISSRPETGPYPLVKSSRRLAMCCKFSMTAVAAALLIASSAGITLPAFADDGGSASRAKPAQARNELSETLLALRVRMRLLQEIKADALPVVVEADGDAITLSGEMRKKSSLELAVNIAKSIDGVKGVHSKLTLAPPADGAGAVKSSVVNGGHEVADALLEARIKTRLLTEIGLGAFKVEVEATDGVASLSGSVPDRDHHDRALKIASGTSGAKEVHDLMKTAPKGPGK